MNTQEGPGQTLDELYANVLTLPPEMVSMDDEMLNRVPLNEDFIRHWLNLETERLSLAFKGRPEAYELLASIQVLLNTVDESYGLYVRLADEYGPTAVEIRAMKREVDPGNINAVEANPDLASAWSVVIRRQNGIKHDSLAVDVEILEPMVNQLDGNSFYFPIITPDGQSFVIGNSNPTAAEVYTAGFDHHIHGMSGDDVTMVAALLGAYIRESLDHNEIP